MDDRTTILRLAAQCAERGEAFVMATVTATQGSSPRGAGAKLLWRPGHGLSGTVGGGQFEHMVIEHARGHFVGKSCGTERYVLGAEAGQCCGGTMDVFFEFVGAKQRVVLFGGGHVSGELVRLLERAAMEIVVVDDREAWNNPERFPGCRLLRDYDAGVEAAVESPATTLACVMTYSHDIDFDVICGLLSAPEPPAFVGLIGSKSKWGCFRGRFRSRGIPESLVETVRCPIGIGDMGKAPAMVAISIAGQLLMEARRLGAVSADAVES